MAASSPPHPADLSPSGVAAARVQWRLRKHAEYQRVYKATRKQFSTSMTYFAAPQSPVAAETGGLPRVGLTAGRVLGKAVERNRIKRRMREAVRRSLHLLPGGTDVVLHPRRTVLALEFAQLLKEVERIFTKIAAATPDTRQ